MSFQLVRASDDRIVIWQTEHGHIYVFTVRPDIDALEPTYARAAPDAAEAPEAFAAAALLFATAEARSRHLIGGAPAKRRRRGAGATATAG